MRPTKREEVHPDATVTIDTLPALAISSADQFSLLVQSVLMQDSGLHDQVKMFALIAQQRKVFQGIAIHQDGVGKGAVRGNILEPADELGILPANVLGRRRARGGDDSQNEEESRATKVGRDFHEGAGYSTNPRGLLISEGEINIRPRGIKSTRSLIARLSTEIRNRS